jgi:hypothetical protein
MSLRGGMAYADEAIAFNFEIATLAQTASLAMTI